MDNIQYYKYIYCGVLTMEKMSLLLYGIWWFVIIHTLYFAIHMYCNRCLIITYQTVPGALLLFRSHYYLKYLSRFITIDQFMMPFR